MQSEGSPNINLSHSLDNNLGDNVLECLKPKI